MKRLDKQLPTRPGIFSKVVSVTNGIRQLTFYQYSTTSVAVDLVHFWRLTTAATLLGEILLEA